MGAPFAPALVAVLIYRLFNFWLPIIPALMLIPTIRELRARFQRAEQEATEAATCCGAVLLSGLACGRSLHTPDDDRETPVADALRRGFASSITRQCA